MKIKGDRVNIPFLGVDRDSIKKAKDYAQNKYPNCIYKYCKPEFIAIKGKFKHESFWTHPCIVVSITKINQKKYDKRLGERIY